mmetsp:Transcript_26469/g.76308  ORF Transcript_26469/g.76308 Transcript_26469/m.76308 type:complete len:417 (+) Transcript_26469:1-1251(+)
MMASTPGVGASWWSVDLGAWFARCCAVERVGASVVRSSSGLSACSAASPSHAPAGATYIPPPGAEDGHPLVGNSSVRSRVRSPSPVALPGTPSLCGADDGRSSAGVEAITISLPSQTGAGPGVLRSSSVGSLGANARRAYSWSPCSTPRVSPPQAASASGSAPKSRAASRNFSGGFSQEPSSRASSRPPRAPSPMSVTGSARQLPESAGSGFWASSVFSRLDVDSKGQGKWQRMELKELLTPVWSCSVAAYTEFRYAFRTGSLVPLPPPLGMHHTFLILEVVGGKFRSAGVAAAKYELSIERWDNRLEVMLGERMAIRSVATRHRATGQPRGIDPERPLEEASRVELGATAGLPALKVADLFAWIAGPLADAWQPYDLARMHCQHFSADLVRFLQCDEEREIKMHALHPRPPPVGC